MNAIRNSTPPTTLVAIVATLFFTVGALGVWTGYVWIAWWAAWSFNDLITYSPLITPLLVAVAPLAWTYARELIAAIDSTTPSITDHAATGGRWLWLTLSASTLIAALAVTVFNNDGDHTLAWILFCGSSISLLYFRPAMQFAASKSSYAVDHGVRPLAFFIVAGAGLALAYASSTNTDADDTHFIGAIISLFEFPAAPLFRYDSIFGESELTNHVYTQNRGQSWEALIGLLSTTLQVDHLALYYWWLPLLLLPLAPIPIYLFLRRYHPQLAFFGTTFALVFLLAWSTDNHHAGHFFVPRFFQGKSILVSILIPAIVIATRHLAMRPGWRATLVLTLLFIGSGGLSSSGLYVGVAVAGLAYLAFVPYQPRAALPTTCWLALAALPNTLMMLDLYQHLAEIPKPEPELWTQVVGEAVPNSAQTLYSQFGGAKNLAAVMLLTWLAVLYTRMLRDRDETSPETTRLLLVFIVVAFNRPLADALAGFFGVSNIAWRWLWTLPLSLVLGLTAAAGARLALSSTKFVLPVDMPCSLTYLQSRPVLSALYWLPLAALLALLTLNTNHLTGQYSLEFRKLKLYPEQQAILTYFRNENLSGRVILGDVRATQLLPRIQHKARVVSAGALYWAAPYFNTDETVRRIRLERIINAKNTLPAEQLTFLREQISERGINMLVFERARDAMSPVTSTVIELGMDCHDIDRWSVCKTAQIGRQ